MAPSRWILAIPHLSHLKPIQLTPVPENVKVAVAPASGAITAKSPLSVTPVLVLVTPDQETAGASVAELSSKRVDEAALDTVTVTGAEVVRLPAASRATAVRVCEPLATVVVFQETEYGDAVSSAPRLAPSTRNCTPATPILSEAEALTVTVPDTVAPDAGALMLTEGGVVSGGGGDEPPLVTSKASTRIQ